MELSEALFNLMHAVRGNLGQQVKLLDKDLSPMHLKSMKVITRLEACTGQKMADFMGRDKAQVNRLIKELVKQELVVKADNPADKRSQILVLSDKGADIMKRFKIAEKQLFNTMSEGVPKEQLGEVVEVLEKLHANLQGITLVE